MRPIDENTIIAVDVSAAMPSKYIIHLLNMVKKLHPLDEIKIMLCGSGVHEITSADKLDNVKICSGGGNDFRATFDKINELNLGPSLLIYLTDGMGVYPCEPPKYPVLWCLTDEYGMKWIPWGGKHLLKIEEEKNNARF